MAKPLLPWQQLPLQQHFLNISRRTRAWAPGVSLPWKSTKKGAALLPITRK